MSISGPERIGKPSSSDASSADIILSEDDRRLFDVLLNHRFSSPRPVRKWFIAVYMGLMESYDAYFLTGLRLLLSSYRLIWWVSASIVRIWYWVERTISFNTLISSSFSSRILLTPAISSLTAVLSLSDNFFAKRFYSSAFVSSELI